MKPNELTVGNLIICYGEIAEITCVGSNGISAKYSGKNGKCHAKFSNPTLQPILLTEKWLHKFCFESYFTSDPQERHASKAFRIGDIIIHMCNEDVQEFVFESFEFIYIKTVSQLQNLYFALTGEEITLKSKE